MIAMVQDQTEKENEEKNEAETQPANGHVMSFQGRSSKSIYYDSSTDDQSDGI